MHSSYLQLSTIERSRCCEAVRNKPLPALAGERLGIRVAIVEVLYLGFVAYVKSSVRNGEAGRQAPLYRFTSG